MNEFKILKYSFLLNTYCRKDNGDVVLFVMEGKEGESISGFVHNLSPVKNGPQKKYFDFNLQTGEKTIVQTICFSPKKRKRIKEAMEKCSPIKM